MSSIAMEQIVDEIIQNAQTRNTLMVPMLPHDLVIHNPDGTILTFPKVGTSIRATTQESKSGGKLKNGVNWIHPPEVSGLELVPDVNQVTPWSCIGTRWYELVGVLRHDKLGKFLLAKDCEIVIVVSEFAAREIPSALFDFPLYPQIKFAYPDTGNASVVRDQRGVIIGVKRLIMVKLEGGFLVPKKKL